MNEVIVIGGGAAGLIASWRAASLGASVTLLEKTERLGTKILISGGGKCNITHDGPIEDVIRAFRPNEARFIRPSCYKFPNTEIVRMLTSRGLRVYTRSDGRIFPVDQTARDVVGILESYVREAGVKVRMRSPVESIQESAEGLVVTLKSGETIEGVVVLATGGSSYPKTGSTGDGWPWAKALGHTIVPVKAALAPMDVKLGNVGWPFPAGVALRSIVLKARSKKEIARWRGDLLFTHHGVSGPAALGVSREVEEHRSSGVTLLVDLAPDEPEDLLRKAVFAWYEANARKMATSFPVPSLPESLLPLFFESTGIHPTQRSLELSKQDKNRLVEAIKSWPIGQVSRVPIEKGEVVAGGVSLDEVDYQTMASKICPGLYLCGEVLDIAGPVGGYNLQAAFATGYVAGESAAGFEK